MFCPIVTVFVGDLSVGLGVNDEVAMAENLSTYVITQCAVT